MDVVTTSNYTLSMIFEWDPEKDIVSQQKHHISFSEAQEVFDDPLHVSFLDYRYSYFEERWITLGRSKARKILVAANFFFNADGEEIVRIISAREACSNERRQYEEI